MRHAQGDWETASISRGPTGSSFGLILHPAGAWLWTVFYTGSRREDREANVYKELQEPPTFETGTPFFRRYSAGALVSRALLQMKGVQRPTETSHCSCPCCRF